MTEQFHFALILQLTVLLAVANGTPVVAKRIFGDRFSYPIDAGLALKDGRRLFGPSKTVRGVLFSVVVTSIASALIGLGPAMGALISVTAMIGDLISSFIKRRLNFPTSSRATGLDQVPESLLPLLASRYFVPLGALDIAATVAIFVIGEIVLSPLLHSAHIRDEPY
jgi:CDP-diglyceride synthetase